MPAFGDERSAPIGGLVMRWVVSIAFIVLSMCLVQPAPAGAHPALGSTSPSFSLVFSDGFTALNTTTWTRYNGTPRCCASTIWAPSHVVTQNGLLNLETYRDSAYNGAWVSAGISMGKSLNQTDGEWVMRFRMDKGKGVGMCVALWPQSGWPPEIDWAEQTSNDGALRNVETATLHYTAKNLEIHNTVSADFSSWHIMAVQWTPGKIVYLLDGHPWGTVTGSMVPNQPMHLTIQTQVGSNGFTGVMPDSTTPANVNLQIDWVRVYKYA